MTLGRRRLKLLPYPIYNYGYITSGPRTAYQGRYAAAGSDKGNEGASDMTQESVITDEMRAAIGVDSEPITYDVEKGAIVKFAQAIGDANPLYNDEEAARRTRYGGLIAPPTFMRSLISNPAPDFKSPYPANLDGGSQWEYFYPVRPGDRITVSTRLANLFERPGRLGNMLFSVRETKYVNQFGQTVAIQRTTGISYQP